MVHGPWMEMGRWGIGRRHVQYEYCTYYYYYFYNYYYHTILDTPNQRRIVDVFNLWRTFLVASIQYNKQFLSRESILMPTTVTLKSSAIRSASLHEASKHEYPPRLRM